MNELDIIFNELYLEKKSDSEEVLIVDSAFSAYMTTIITGSKMVKLDSLNADCTMAYEHQGFINGFRYALKLLSC